MNNSLAIIALFAAFGLGACAPAIERIALPNDALLPAPPPNLIVGQTKIWCEGENNAETCDQHKVTIADLAADGCVTTSDEEDQYTHCLHKGPYFIATRWDGSSYGKGERIWSLEEGALWPLEVGRHYSFDESGTNDQGEDWSRHGELKVTGIEKVTVPAGTFDSYRIEIFLGSDRYYEINYAPELGSNVFYHRRSHSRGDGKPYYLMEIIPPTS